VRLDADGPVTVVQDASVDGVRLLVGPDVALEVLDGLAELRPTLVELAAARRRADLTRAAVELAAGEPLLADWVSLRLDRRRDEAAGERVMLFYGGQADRLEKYADRERLPLQTLGGGSAVEVRVGTPAGLVVLHGSEPQPPRARPGWDRGGPVRLADRLAAGGGL